MHPSITQGLAAQRRRELLQTAERRRADRPLAQAWIPGHRAALEAWLGRILIRAGWRLIEAKADPALRGAPPGGAAWRG